MRAKQLILPLREKHGHGGRRAGAGRKKGTGLQGHTRRPRLLRRHPVHVTLKLEAGLPSLRRKDLFGCLRRAVATARKRGLIVAHFALLSNHLHLILEPQGESVATPIQSLCISFAKRVNLLLARQGRVFLDRYHLHILRTPTEVRRVLAYVLTNEARHRGKALSVRIDPFSSAGAFEQWRDLIGTRVVLEPTLWSEDTVDVWLKEILGPPQTWLLTEGWHRARPETAA